MRFALTRICLTVPSYPSVAIGRAATAEAKLKLADALLAAKRFHLANGELPQEIASLAPDFIPQLPADPLAPKQQITLSRITEGIRLSSVGILSDPKLQEADFYPPRAGALVLELRIPEKPE